MNVRAELVENLIGKVRKLLESTTVSMCIARALDRRTCHQVLDIVHCRQRLLVWSRHSSVCDFFLLSDPG